MKYFNKKLSVLLLSCLIVAMLVTGCGKSSKPAANNTDKSAATNEEATKKEAMFATSELDEVNYKLASKAEGEELLLENASYFENFSSCDLLLRGLDENSTVDAITAFAAGEVKDFTDEEKEIVDNGAKWFCSALKRKNFHVPEIGEVTFVRTSGAEEMNVPGYIHGTTIYVTDSLIELGSEADKRAYYSEIAKLFFHYLTKSNSDFKTAMYSLINFKVNTEDYALPELCKANFVSSPSYEHYNACASFTINGSKIDCYTIKTVDPLSSKDGSLFENVSVSLVPVDGTDAMYSIDDATDFYEVFGQNASDNSNPDACLAENFAKLINYGEMGPGNAGFASQDIIDGMLSLLTL